MHAGHFVCQVWMGGKQSSYHYTWIDFFGCSPLRVSQAACKTSGVLGMCDTPRPPPSPRHATSSLGRETHLPARPNAAHMSCCICLCFAFWAMLGLDKHTDIGAAVNTSAVVSLALTVAFALTSWPWCALR
jgi:hypothetical protein